MPVKKILNRLSTFVFVLIVLPSVCLSQKDTARFHFSIRAGFGISLTQDIDYLKNKGFERTNLITWLGGVSGVYNVNIHFLLGADVHFTQRGTNYQQVNDSLIYVTTNQSGVVQKTENVYFFTQNILYGIDFPIYATLGSFNKQYSPFLKIGINSSFTLKQIQREYTWVGTTKKVNDFKTHNTSGRYYPGLILAAGLKVKRLLLQASYTNYPNTKVVYYDFTGKTNSYSLVFSLAYIIKKNKKRKPNPLMQLYSPAGS